MTQQHEQDISDTLALMGLDEQGVKKGSRIIPLLTLLFAAIAFLVYALPKGGSQLDDLFKVACENVANVNAAGSTVPGAAGTTSITEVTTPAAALAVSSTKTLADKAKNEQKCTPEPSSKKSFRDRCVTATQSSRDVLATEYSKLCIGPRVSGLIGFGYEAVGGFPGIKTGTTGVVKSYIEELVGDFGTIIKTLFITIGILSLYALIPGLAGMIYRRSFWTWFLVAFAGLYAINAWAPKSITGVDAMPGSGPILGFIVLQLVILLLAFRLRTYSSSVSKIPVRYYNIGVAAVLALVALACFYNWGSWIWSFLLRDNWFYKGQFLLIGLPVLYTLLRKSDLWDGAERKNIVMLLDGTNNTPGQTERGQLAQTNVFKLFNMLKPDGPEGYIKSGTFDASITKKYGDKQIAFYYTGVGNKFDSSAIGQTLGQATGMGAADIVERGYLDVMRVYRPGDRIFIFGFSRGAAIARLLASAIGTRGAPKRLLSLKLFGRHRMLWKSKPDKKHGARVPICVLGCWDTVGAFGIGKKILGIDFQKVDLFKDLTVSDNVEQVYHMLALDEKRDAFAPTLMDPDPITPERVKELWFSGDHANIGGGWATSKLSDVTLDFLLGHVSSGYAQDVSLRPGDESWGLYLSALNGKKVTANPDNPDHNGAAVLDPDPLGQLRQVTSNLYDDETRKLPVHAVISETVFERMAESMPVYAPQSLFDHDAALTEKRESVAAAVERLMATQSLSPKEHASILEYKDKLRLTRWPQYLAWLNEARSPKKPDERLSNAAPADDIA